MEIEKEYRLDDSYNRTNWIVLQVLDDPARLPDLRDEIEDGRDDPGSRIRRWPHDRLGILVNVARPRAGCRQQLPDAATDQGRVIVLPGAMTDENPQVEAP